MTTEWCVYCNWVRSGTVICTDVGSSLVLVNLSLSKLSSHTLDELHASLSTTPANFLPPRYVGVVVLRT